MPRRTLYRAMLVTISCAVLLSMAPVTAGAWRERMSGTIGAWSPGSRPVVIEALKYGGERAVSEAQDMSIPLFITKEILRRSPPISTLSLCPRCYPLGQWIWRRSACGIWGEEYKE